MARRRMRRLACAGSAVGAAYLVWTPGGRRVARRGLQVAARRARYEAGRLDGVRYRLAGRGPDPAATDRVLADRVRSMLGALEHQLDVPRVHVTAEGHRVLLHGSVDTDDHVAALEAAVRAVPGVGQVVSHLRVGLGVGDTRPSEGASHPVESRALQSLLAAAHGGGAAPGTERASVRGVLSSFAALVPAGERRHVLAHLPDDVRMLADADALSDRRPPRRLERFAVGALPMTDPQRRQDVVESVIGALRELVPEEAADIAAVLPEDFRRLWKLAVPM